MVCLIVDFKQVNVGSVICVSLHSRAYHFQEKKKSKLNSTAAILRCSTKKAVSLNSVKFTGSTCAGVFFFDAVCT